MRQNGVWSLNVLPVQKEIVTSNGVNYPQIIYTLVLSRYSTYYVMAILVPGGLLAALNCIVHKLPLESGERMTFSISNLLAAILFQQLVGAIMPPLGDDYCILGRYFMSNLKSTNVIIFLLLIIFQNINSSQCLPKSCMSGKVLYN